MPGDLRHIMGRLCNVLFPYSGAKGYMQGIAYSFPAVLATVALMLPEHDLIVSYLQCLSAQTTQMIQTTKP